MQAGLRLHCLLATKASFLRLGPYNNFANNFGLSENKRVSKTTCEK